MQLGSSYWARVRRAVQAVCQSEDFELLVVLAIFGNLALLASYDPRKGAVGTNAKLEQAELGLTVFFTVELVIRIVSVGGFFRYFRQSFWHTPDALLILIGYGILVPGIAKQTQAARSLRAVRALRTLRTLAHSDSLQEVLRTISSARSLLMRVGMLLVLFLLLFSIPAIRLFRTGFYTRCRPAVEPLPPGSGEYALSCAKDEDACLEPWFQCEDVGPGIKFGFSGYGNIFFAFLTSFIVMTQEDWENVMALAIGGINFAVSAIFHVFMQIVLPYAILNIFFGVLKVAWAQALGRTGSRRSSTGLGLRESHVKKALKICWERCEEAMARQQARLQMSRFGKGLNALVQTKVFNALFIVIVTMNMVTLALDHWGQPERMTRVLEILEMTFAAFFIIEAAMKLLGLGVKEYFSDVFNAVDFAVSAVASVELVNFVFKEFGNPFLTPLGTVARLLKGLRAFRVFRLFRHMESVRLIMGVVLLRGNSFLATSFLLIFFNALLAIFSMHLFGGLALNDKLAYVNFPQAFEIFFLVLTVENWQQLMFSTAEQTTYASLLLYIPWVLLGRYVFLSLQTSILIEVFETRYDEDKAIENLFNTGQERRSWFRDAISNAWEWMRSLCCGQRSSERAGGGINRSMFSMTVGRFRGMQANDFAFETWGRYPDWNDQRNSTRWAEHHENRGVPPGQGQQGMVIEEEVSNDSEADDYSVDSAYAQDREQGRHVGNGGDDGKSQRLHRVSNIASQANMTAEMGENVASNGEGNGKETAGERPLGAALSTAESMSAAGIETPSATALSTNHHGGSTSGISVSKSATFLNEDASGKENQPEETFSLEDGKRLVNQVWALGCVPPGARVRFWALYAITHWSFEAFFSTLILASCAAMIAERPDMSSGETRTFFALNLTFVVFFWIEAVIKSLPGGFSFYIGSNANKLDFFIVIGSTVSLISSSFGPGTLRGIRVLRALRALRPLRAFSRSRGLRAVLRALHLSMSSMITVLVIILLSMFAFGVLGVQLFKGLFFKCNDQDIILEENCDGSFVNPLGEVEERKWELPYLHFDNLGRSILTLFFTLTMDSYLQALFDAMDVKGVGKAPVRSATAPSRMDWNMLFFNTFIMVNSFVLINTFLGVIYLQFTRLRMMSRSESKTLTWEQRQWKVLAKHALNLEPESRPPRPSNRLRAICWKISFHRYFNRFILFCITSNITLMATVHQGESDTLVRARTAAQTFFNIVFVLEAAIKWCGMGPRYYLKRFMDKVEFALACIALVDVVLFSLRESGSSQGNAVSIIELLIILRVFRLFRIMYSYKGMRNLLATIVNSFPAMRSIAAVNIIAIFVFAYSGMLAFGLVLRQPNGLNEVRNYETVPNAMLTLFEMATASNWVLIVRGAGIDESNSDCSEAENNCGAPIGSIIFSLLYMMVMYVVLINLWSAAVVENFEEQHKGERFDVTPSDLESFAELWSKRSTPGKTTMTVAHFVKLLELMPTRMQHTLGIDRLRSRAELIRLLNSLDIYLDEEGEVPFHVALFHLIRDSFEVELPEGDITDELIEKIRYKVYGWRRVKGRWQTQTYLSEHRVGSLVAAVFAQRRWRIAAANQRLSRKLSLERSNRHRGGSLVGDGHGHSTFSRIWHPFAESLRQSLHLGGRPLEDANQSSLFQRS